MKRKLSMLMVLCLLLPLCAYADTFTATGTFPLPEMQRLSRVKPAPDGGVYVFGCDLDEQGQSLNVCVLMDREGNEQWRISLAYDEKKLVRFTDCVDLPDGSVALHRSETPDFNDMRDIPLEEIVRVKDGVITGVDVVGSGEEWYMWLILLPVEDGYMVAYTKGDPHGKTEAGSMLYRTTAEVYTPDGKMVWQCVLDEMTIALQQAAKVQGGYVLTGVKKEGFGNTEHNLGIIIMVSDDGEVQWQEVMEGSATTFGSMCGDVVVHADGSFSVTTVKMPVDFEEEHTYERHRYSPTGEALSPLPADAAHLAYRNLTPFENGYVGFVYEEEGRKPIKLVILDENHTEQAVHDIVYEEKVFDAQGWADMAEPDNIRLLLMAREAGDYTVDLTLFEAK